MEVGGGAGGKKGNRRSADEERPCKKDGGMPSADGKILRYKSLRMTRQKREWVILDRYVFEWRNLRRKGLP